MWLQGTREMGCMAHVEVKAYTLYPQYAVSEGEKEGISTWKLRCLKEEKMKNFTHPKHYNNMPSILCRFPLRKPTQDIR